jgi:hypothetical protein
MATNKTDLKKYFQTGDKPTQAEYSELIDAFRHVDNSLPIIDVENLQTSLDAKAANETLLNHINDDSAHGNLVLDGADIKLAYEAEANTNAFTDPEKQHVTDGVTHRADNDSHVSSSDKTKWNNQLAEYSTGEVITSEMGYVYRIYNGSLYKYVGDYPNTNTFTTSDIITELEETPARWVDILSTFPPVEFAVLSPKSIAPSTTRFIQIDASNIKLGTTLDLGTDITVLSYQYISEKQMLVEIQSNNNHGSVFPKVNNGKVTTLIEQFSISEGEIYIPNTLDTSWMSTHNDIVYDVGSWEAQTNGSRYIGYFSEIPTDNDFTLGMRIHAPADGSAQIYFGFKTIPTNTTANGDTDYFFRLYTGSNTFHSFNTINWTPGSFFEIKRTKIPNTSTATLEFYVDSNLEGSVNVNVNGNWYPYFYTYTANKVSELELKIL